MKESRFSLADVIMILSVLIFGFLSFLGANFSTLGNTKQSIIISIIISVSLGVTAYIAKTLKGSSRKFIISFIFEISFLFLFFVLVSIFSYKVFPHYFAVSKNKSEIKNELNTSIIQAEKMFEEYDEYVEGRQSSYESILRSVVATRRTLPRQFTDFGFTYSVPFDTQIKNKLFKLEKKLIPSNYSNVEDQDGIKEVAKKWLIDAKKAIEKWNPIRIVNVINSMEEKTEEWRNLLIDLSKENEPGEPSHTEFDYPLLFKEVKSFFEKDTEPTILSMIVAIILIFLMLFSYLITNRDIKVDLKKIFCGMKTDENEL